jgi:hypothetical protein
VTPPADRHLRALLEAVRKGERSIDDALQQLRREPPAAASMSRCVRSVRLRNRSSMVFAGT